MRKWKIIHKQLDIPSEDMFQMEYGPFILDVWYNGTLYKLQIISNYDWENPVEIFEFEKQEDIKKYIDIYKKKLEEWEYNTEYIYKYESIEKYLFSWIPWFRQLVEEEWLDSDEWLELKYTMTSCLARFVKKYYLNESWECIWDSFEFDTIMDSMNELLEYWEHKVQELVIVGFIEDLQIPTQYLDKMKQLVKYPKLQKAIQDIENFWMKWIVIP